MPMIHPSEAVHELAAKNLDQALAMARTFPENPFCEKWDAFYFFDPDLLFESQFAETLGLLLSCEDGRSVCLRNIDLASAGSTAEEASIFLEVNTTGKAYMDQLRGGGPGRGWLYRPERYAYASDVGDWCIYCERANEIAVIAVRWRGVSDRFAVPLRHLNALPIQEAIEKPSSYGLSPRGLLEEWRKKMLLAFAPGSHPT